MTRLTETSLEFSKEHIERFYASDFFPTQFEFEAIWHCWDVVKAELLSIEVPLTYETSPLIALPWKKTRGGYRVVHQLDPVDCIVYTALAFLCADSIEKGRAPVDKKIACAYRIQTENGSFFSFGHGYDDFKEKSRELAAQYQWVLVLDIADFYNQIYLHRLQNAIAYANPQLAPLATDVERFLSKLNVRVSQGVPVGPAASILFSESTLTDVDQFLIDFGVKHTRYVDDFRIFSDSKSQLETVHRNLTLYLHETHRLSFSSEKTRVVESKAFVEIELDNQYEQEKDELLAEIEASADYASEEERDEEWEEDLDIDADAFQQKITQAFIALCARPHLDLGLARTLLRQARAHKIVDIVDLSFEKIDILLPVFNNLMLFWRDICVVYGEKEFKEKLEVLTRQEHLLYELERIWFEWLLLETKLYQGHESLRNYLLESPNLETQAQLAYLEGNVTWVRRFKNHTHGLGSKARRSVLYASRILPDDERIPWLKQLKRTLSSTVDRCMIEWAMDWGDIPF